jgi:hypothetical protein
MQKLTNKRLAGISSGVAASIALHALVAAVLLFKMPLPQTEPEKEEAVQVDLVPPPEEKKEEPKPEEKKPEEQAKKEEPPPPPPPEEKKPEEKAKEEPPPPPPEEKKAEEKKAEEPKPEEKKPEEQAKREPPPPPPPPPPPEEKKAEEQKAEPPKAEQEAENKQADGKQGQGAPMPVLKPVFQFGDKDSGPKKSDAGNSSTGEVKPATSAPDHKDETGEPKPAADAGDKPDAPKEPPAKPVPDDIDLPQVDIADAHSQNNAPAVDAAGEAMTSIEQAKPVDQKPTEPDKPDAPKKDELAEAKTLFSPDESDDPVARTAMLGIPRGRRAAQLCSTELREQLVHGSPAYRPVIVPMYGLAKGTVLDVKRGAFRTAETWYDVQFRCEVNEDATAIVSFALDVGSAVPRSQWRSRRFPE